jgi:hypothetical protein
MTSFDYLLRVIVEKRNQQCKLKGRAGGKDKPWDAFMEHRAVMENNMATPWSSPQV